MAGFGMKQGAIRRHAEDIDRHVGMRMRQRRIMLGLTQRQMADWIGLTYQQACKYESGANRISAGRLHLIAQSLNVDVAYFFDGLGDPLEMTERQRAFLGLARNFIAIPNLKHQEELVSLARALAEPSIAMDERGRVGLADPS
jgi:transcriptional regulator with XRE-family HTH domain